MSLIPSPRQLVVDITCVSAFALIVTFAHVGRCDPPEREDLYGDKLPECAIARLGTHRFHYSSQILCAAMSPDGQVVATGHRDGSIVLWDSKSGRILRSIAQLHKNGVFPIGFSRDGAAIVSAGGDSLIVVSDATTGKTLRHAKFFQHSAHLRDVPSPYSIRTLELSPDKSRVVAADRDGLLAYFELRENGDDVLMQKRVNMGQGELHVSFSPDGLTLFANSGAHREIQVFKANDGSVLHEAVGGPSLSFSISSNGKLLALVGSDRALRIIDTKTLKESYKIESPHGAEPFNAEFSRKGMTLYTASTTRVRAWDARSFTEISGGNVSIPDNVIATDFERNMSIVRERGGYAFKDVSFAPGFHEPQSHSEGDLTLAFSPDASMIITGGSNDASTRLWDIKKQRQVWKIAGLFAPIAISRDGALALLIEQGNHYRLVETATGKMQSSKGELVLVCGLPGSCAVMPSNGAHVSVFDDGRKVADFDVDFAPRHCGEIAVSGDSQLIAFATVAGEMRLVSAEAGETAIANTRGAFSSIRFARNRKSLFAAGRDLVDYSLDGARPTAIIHGDRATNWGPQRLSPDGSVVAGIVDGDRAVIRDFGTGKTIATLPTEGTELPCELCFSPDGRHLACSTWRCTVLIFDVKALLKERRVDWASPNDRKTPCQSKRAG